jgi:hypothetical protein
MKGKINLIILLLVLIACTCTVYAFEFPPGNDTLLVQVTRAPHPIAEDKYWEPYTVWWVEDAAGNLVKILFITFYDDRHDNVQPICGKTGYLYTLTYYRDRFGDDGCPDRFLDEWCTPPRCPNCPFDYSDLVDGITGCTEPMDANNASVMTRPWDLTDRDGNQVPAGTYSIYYSGVIRDEEEIHHGQDKVFGVTVSIGSRTFDTTFLDLQDIYGHADDPHFQVSKIRVALGPNSLAGGSQQGPGPQGPADAALPNKPPDPPTVSAPSEGGFCGSGTGVSAAIVLVFIGAGNFRRRRKKELHKLL